MGNARTGQGRSCPSPVHPHVHGERESSVGFRPGFLGSSPRTWGTHPQLADQGRLPRFIPTYMGNARGGRRRPGFQPVHPHVQGERMGFSHPIDKRFSHVHGEGCCKTVILTLSAFIPRTWNANRRYAKPRPRFIPTYIGNAGAREQFMTRRSSHYMGNATEEPAHAPVCRFIPTYMGTLSHCGDVIKSVHPHYVGNAP